MKFIVKLLPKFLRRLLYDQIKAEVLGLDEADVEHLKTAVLVYLGELLGV